jgi:hypothetical protein
MFGAEWGYGGYTQFHLVVWIILVAAVAGGRLALTISSIGKTKAAPLALNGAAVNFCAKR